jgi:hypothetical protein
MTEDLSQMNVGLETKCLLNFNNMYINSNLHEQGIIVNGIIPPHNSSIH